MAWPPIIYKVDSVLIVDSAYFAGKSTQAEFINIDSIPIKSVLTFNMVGEGFHIDIFRDDTTLVGQHTGSYQIMSDTIRFNVGDSIIQDYGLTNLNSTSFRIYDFNWPNSHGITFINIPHDYILWWEYARKTKGVFIREDFPEE